MKGKFITLEGPDGAGKSTNIELVREYLHSCGIEVCLTREPGGTEAGELVREILINRDDLTPITELLLIFAARAQHLERIIGPALASGRWVVCDRYIDATYAYQGFGRDLGLEVIQNIQSILPGFSLPDLTLLFDIPINLSLERMKSRASLDRFEAQEIDFLNKVRVGYKHCAKQFPERIKIIDSSNSILEVKQSILLELDAFLKL